MSLDPEIFAAALPWEAYVASVTVNRQLLLDRVEGFRLPPYEEAFWMDFRRPLNVLVFTEDWCHDSIAALPPLLAVARIAPAITVRLLRRSDALALEQALLRDEYPPIPVFLFYDENFTELGRFVEQPEGWDRLLQDPEHRAWLRSDPDAYDLLWSDLELDQIRGIVGG